MVVSVCWMIPFFTCKTWSISIIIISTSSDVSKGLRIIHDFVTEWLSFTSTPTIIMQKKVSVFKQGISFILVGNSLPSVSQAAAKSSQAYCILPATGHNATAA